MAIKARATSPAHVNVRNQDLESSAATPAADAHENSHSTRKPQDLTIFFAVAYLCLGLACAQFGLLAQPLQYFMMKGQHLSAADTASCMALLMFPWVIKPLYGLVCDFIPLAGYKQKSYLFAANVVTAGALLVLTFTGYLPAITCSLLLAAVAMAVSTALLIALAVEAGRRDGKARHYFAVQEIWYYGASICAAIAGGALCQHFKPGEAFHIASALGILPAITCCWLALFVLQEEKTTLNLEAVKLTGKSLLKAFKTKALWITGAFSFLWSFSPAFGVPLYFFEANSLHFSQQQIGHLAAVNAVGMLIGAILHRKMIRIMSIRSQLYITCAMVVTGIAGYYFLSTFPLAVGLEFVRGIAGMFAILGVYGLAADVCPVRSEVSVMALLVAIRNVATNAATYTGGQLFTHAFHNEFAPLVLVTMVAPLLSFCLVPLATATSKQSNKVTPS
ncbi:MAG: MFS transporter [Candidatus Obscuribacterales bacterium]|nr:MFS transporter [Candidatus Obscuribacterales bacterium]